MRVKPEWGAPKKGGPRQVPCSPPFKHTTDYNTPQTTPQRYIIDTKKQKP